MYNLYNMTSSLFFQHRQVAESAEGTGPEFIVRARAILSGSSWRHVCDRGAIILLLSTPSDRLFILRITRCVQVAETCDTPAFKEGTLKA